VIKNLNLLCAVKVWLSNHNRFYGGLERKVSGVALGTLLAHGDPRLETLLLRPQAVTAAAGKITEVNNAAPRESCIVRLFALVTEEAWRSEVQRASSTAQNELKGDASDDESDDGGVLLSEMCGGWMGQNADEDSGDEDDPIHQVDLLEHLVASLRAYAVLDQVRFEGLFAGTASDKQAFLRAQFERGA